MCIDCMRSFDVINVDCTFAFFLNLGHVYGNIRANFSFSCTAYASGFISYYLADCFESDWFSSWHSSQCLSLFLVRQSIRMIQRFVIGVFRRFNVCCLLGLSCLAISFGVCSLPLISDLATFYLTSLILGIGLGISYNGKNRDSFTNANETSW